MTFNGARMNRAFLAAILLSLALTGTPSRADVQARTDPASPPTALDRYVAAPDPSYAYKVNSTFSADGLTGTVLRVTSQTWLTDKEVNYPVWEHWLTIVRPPKVASPTALLFITGGSRDRGAPRSVDRNLAAVAKATNCVVAELRGVPNQPLVFAGETESRSEDSLIAYTWDKYLNTGDERWPARLPMTKSAVRAMDTVTAFCATPEGGGLRVDSFVVAGASKRGWTTWTTAAVDKRVVAAIPIVIDTLNVQKSSAHHYAAYGFFAPSLQDYVDMKIMAWAGTPQYAALLKIEEPYEYRPRLTMPKFIINATGDQYFPPDNSQFYFDDLPGVKYLRYVPNADHSLEGSDAAQTLIACFAAVVARAPLPQLSWTWPNEDKVRVEAKTAPVDVKLWQATNPTARDFRVESLGKVWKSSPVTAKGGAYEGHVDKPAKGWAAYFLELTFPGPAGEKGPPYKFTTQVKVVPDVLPFKFPPQPREQGKRAGGRE
jgi:PhoPQ-activated pathogenicity-related protein